MPILVKDRFIAYDGEKFDRFADCLEHEKREQLKFLGFDDRAVDVILANRQAFVLQARRIAPILLWEGGHGVPAHRIRRRKGRGSPTGDAP